MTRARPLRILLPCTPALMLCTGQTCAPRLGLIQTLGDIAAGPDAGWEQFVGGNDARLIFQKVDATSERYVAYDVAGDQATDLQLPQQSVTDGNWALYLDSSGLILHAVNLDTGADTQISPDMGGTNSYFNLESIQGTRAFGSVFRGGQEFRAILDLTAGGKQVLTDDLVSPYQYAAADGDWLAIWYFPPAGGNTGSLLGVDDPALLAAYQSNLDAINLVTGERRSILTGVSAASTSIDPLAVIGNRVVWGAWDYTSSNGAVWSYDLTTAATEKLLELTSDAENWLWIKEIGRSGILIQREVWDEAAGTGTTSFELHGFDGQVYPVMEVPPTADNAIWPELPKFAGNLLIYQDPVTLAWTVFDPRTNTTRAINPFGE